MSEQDEAPRDDGPRHVVAQAGLASASGTASGAGQQEQEQDEPETAGLAQ